eukprot:891912-Amphidinium_carterae.1
MDTGRSLPLLPVHSTEMSAQILAGGPDRRMDRICIGACHKETVCACLLLELFGESSDGAVLCIATSYQ